MTLPTNARIRREVPRHLVVHYADLPPEDVREVEGVPVTTPERTIRDVHTSHIARRSSVRRSTTVGAAGTWHSTRRSDSGASCSPRHSGISSSPGPFMGVSPTIQCV